MKPPRFLLAFSFLMIAALVGPCQTDARRSRLDFLNERLPIPESERFVDSEYVDSGVGLSYGVDKRLSYLSGLSGDYAAAAERFEAATSKFKFKSEIWVNLARAYYYKKEPDRAKETLLRASAAMPDLHDQLWQPLVDGLLWEIRQRANNLQVQVDYYSQSTEDFFTLFRLYKFLEAKQEAIAVVVAADSKETKLMQQSTMSSGSNQRTYRQKAVEWRDLATRLRGELRTAGFAVPARKGAVDAGGGDVAAKAELLEATHALQLKIDYYQASEKDYELLFDNYVKLGELRKAGVVIEAVDRELAKVKVEIAEARDIQEELKHEDHSKALGQRLQRLKDGLAAVKAKGKP